MLMVIAALIVLAIVVAGWCAEGNPYDDGPNMPNTKPRR